VGYRWKGPFNTYNFRMTHFVLNPIFTRVKVKINNLLKRNLPTPVGSAERIFFSTEPYHTYITQRRFQMKLDMYLSNELNSGQCSLFVHAKKQGNQSRDMFECS